MNKRRNPRDTGDHPRDTGFHFARIKTTGAGPLGNTALLLGVRSNKLNESAAAKHGGAQHGQALAKCDCKQDGAVLARGLDQATPDEIVQVISARTLTH